MNEWSVEEAVKAYFERQYKDGDLVSHDWLLYVLKLRQPRTREDGLLLLDRMDAFRKALLEDHCIALENVRGKGYRVVPPAEQAEYAARTAAAHISKGLRKSGQLLEHTRVDELSERERQRHTDTEVRMAGLRSLISRGKRDVFKLFAPEG